MEAQVEKNVKKKTNKQTIKQRKEKKKTHMCRIESLKNWGTGENIGKERTLYELAIAPGLTPRFCGISCRQNSYFLFLAGSFVVNNITWHI